MKPDYLLFRLIRHFMPDGLARFLLRHDVILHPGLETANPRAAVEQYLAALAASARRLDGKRALVFGYGGNFAVGCLLLRAGAKHVILSDRYAPPDHRRNQTLLPEFSRYLSREEKGITPNPEYITLMEGDIRQIAGQRPTSRVELILSTSVYEHLDDVEGVTAALAALTQEDGLHIHHIDLRDHFFKYPFEMLTFSEKAWRYWLNPTSNLNRYRLWQYESIFQKHFKDVEIKVISRDLVGYERARPRMRAEFLSGNPEADAVTQIQVLAARPKNPGQL